MLYVIKSNRACERAICHHFYRDARNFRMYKQARMYRNISFEHQEAESRLQNLSTWESHGGRTNLYPWLHRARAFKTHRRSLIFRTALACIITPSTDNLWGKTRNAHTIRENLPDIFLPRAVSALEQSHFFLKSLWRLVYISRQICK